MSSSSSTIPSIATNRKDSSSVNLLHLPNDLLLNSLARISRLYYPTLSLVSKRFHSLIASNELYETRKLLSRTESYLYLCLRLDALNILWFTLNRKPTRNPNLNKSMVSISTRNFSPPSWCGHYVAVGFNIYMIGGYFNGTLSSKVLFIDCRSHTWHEAPSMQMSVIHTPVSVLDGKIYVAEEGVGSESDYNSSKMIDCFDPKTQTWEPLPSLNGKIRKSCKIQSLAIKGKLYLFGKEDNNMVYKPKENRWDPVMEMDFTKDLVVYFHSTCVIGNVLYQYGYSGKFEWFDFEGRSWRVLKGLGKLYYRLPNHRVGVKLVDYGGKIAVLWRKNQKIWCAVIALERRNIHEIYGKVEWCNVVLTIPGKYSSGYFWQCVAATF